MKYKIFKFENGLGEIWYQIKARINWWTFSYWIQKYYRTGSEPRRFSTEEDCRKYIEHEKEYLRWETLRNQIKTTEINYDI